MAVVGARRPKVVQRRRERERIAPSPAGPLDGAAKRRERSEEKRDMPDIEFPTGAGSTPGYLATPAGERGPATIVLQEWWGLESHIRSICDRLSAEGFYALAPDLYRGATTTQPSEAQQKMMALSMDQAEQDMCGAVEYLRSQPGCEGFGVGSVGFCLGGALSVWAAATCP